jgi:hypothetical protein
MKTSSSSLFVLLFVWALIAVIAGSVHLLAIVPPGMTSLVIGGLIASLIVVFTRVPALVDAIAEFSVRQIVAVHVTRFAGLYFLWLHTQGRLPAEFAFRAGWGDVAAAVGALMFLIWPSALRVGWLFVLWNILGALDLVVAVGTASWLNLTRPGSMIEMAGLPLTLVPLFFVPLLLTSHVLLLRQPLSEKWGRASARV